MSPDELMCAECGGPRPDDHAVGCSIFALDQQPAAALLELVARDLAPHYPDTSRLFGWAARCMRDAHREALAAGSRCPQRLGDVAWPLCALTPEARSRLTPVVRMLVEMAVAD